MAVGLHGAISWFQKKIGTYDKTNWEITVEKQEVTQVLTEKLSVAKLPNDLLDLDLIRGSTFTKAKPGYHWTLVTSKGFLKVLLFPFYYRWWLQQTSIGVWLFFVSLYFLQLVALVIYFFRQPGDDFLGLKVEPLSQYLEVMKEELQERNLIWDFNFQVPQRAMYVSFYICGLPAVVRNIYDAIFDTSSNTSLGLARSSMEEKAIQMVDPEIEESVSTFNHPNKSWPEAVVPLLVMFILGEMYIHVVSTNFTKPISHKIKKKKQRRGRGGRSKQNRHIDDDDKNNRDNNNNNDNANDDDENETTTRAHRGTMGVENILNDRETSVERVLNSTDEDRVIHDSETEVDKTLGVRNRLHGKSKSKSKNDKSKTRDDDNLNNDTTTENDDESITHKNSHSAEDTSAGEDHSDSSTSSISNDEADEQEITDTETADLLFPKCNATNDSLDDPSESNMLRQIRDSNDLITVSMWDGNSFKKVKFTFFEIGLTVVNKVEGATHRSSDYIGIAIISAFIIGFLPIMFRVYQQHVIFKGEPLSQLYNQIQTWEGVNSMIEVMMGPTLKHKTMSSIGILSRITLSFSLFFLLCVAESAYKIRYLYAKYFGALTSTRRARRNRLPHFRLHKVKNIKAWLSLRSFLKKRGPQRSVDTIVSMAAMIDVLLLVIASMSFLCINGKDDGDHFLSYFVSWELSAWSILLGVFLIRFIALGSDINRKYRNQSIILIEQINLYVQMESNPKKKEKLLTANNVLNLASKLLKELEGPFKVHGFIMNPLLSNITRVVVLSLFSGVMSDILGFSLRLWKIKA